jgi:Fe-S-cluster containining protein
LEKYGAAAAEVIDQYHLRSNSHSVYAVGLPCPFFEEVTGYCRIYEARPLVCRLFPIEIEPITGTTYLDKVVCPKNQEAVFGPALVQIAVNEWLETFWRGSKAKKALDQRPIGQSRPENTD